VTFGRAPRVCICCGSEITRVRQEGAPRMVSICLAVYLPLARSGTVKSTKGVRICSKCLATAIAAPWSPEGEKLYGAIIGRLAGLYRSSEGAKVA